MSSRQKIRVGIGTSAGKYHLIFFEQNQVWNEQKTYSILRETMFSAFEHLVCLIKFLMSRKVIP